MCNLQLSTSGLFKTATLSRLDNWLTFERPPFFGWLNIIIMLWHFLRLVFKTMDQNTTSLIWILCSEERSMRYRRYSIFEIDFYNENHPWRKEKLLSKYIGSLCFYEVFALLFTSLCLKILVCLINYLRVMFPLTFARRVDALSRDRIVDRQRNCRTVEVKPDQTVNYTFT